MPKVGGKRKKTKTHAEEEEELTSDIPRSIIVKRGKVGAYLRKLVQELRNIMYPYTAINLKESKANCIRDFLSIVDVFGVSHMMMLTNTATNSYMRLAKMPKGPTITFKIEDYCLASDIFAMNTDKNNKGLNKASTLKPLTKSFNQVPLVIMNGFNSKQIKPEHEEALKIVSIMFQSFFPPINLNEIQLKKCKRVVLLNLAFDENSDPFIEFRHYDIDIQKFSVKKTISNIINSGKSDLSRFNNIADYVLKQSGFTSGSDNEDPNLGVCEMIRDEEDNKDTTSKEKDKELLDKKVRVKLIEIGPRINLRVHKIEEGFLKGNVVYHALINKTKKEIKEMMDKLKAKRKQKRERKATQKSNIAKKEAKKEEVENINVIDNDNNENKNQEETLVKKPRDSKEKEIKFLNRKRALKEKKAKTEHIMTKRSLKQFNNLKKYKK